jgi:hypothetical protein
MRATRSHRRTLAIFIAAGTLLATMGAGHASAATPAVASGGGCAPNWAQVSILDVSVKGCISEDSHRNIVGDVHWSSGNFTLEQCTTDIKVRDDTLGTFREQQSIGCGLVTGTLSFPAIAGHHYHTYWTVTVTDELTGASYPGTIPNSPEQVAG